MLPDFEPRLHAFAEVIVRVGLNLQSGQRLLIAEPYELQGVARSAEVIVEAVLKAAAADVEIIWGDGPRLREFAAQADWRSFAGLVARNARRMTESVRRGDALLFLQGSQPRLLAGLPAGRVAELHRIGWEHFGPVAQQLTQGATNWTIAPAPSPAWAEAAYADLPAGQRLAALWQAIFSATRVTEPDALAAWQIHLRLLRQLRDGLNARHLPSLRYKGEGTDLTVKLPPEHVWRTAQLTTRSGIPFVANLPTEEVFTVPHRTSAEGHVQVSRPVSFGGAVIEGIQLEFSHGRVVAEAARTGAGLLQQLLATDEGARHLGEVAVVSEDTSLGRAGRLFYHPLLDENARSHVALGEAYGFCLRRPNPAALNRSLIHVDLPLDASLIQSDTEPA